MVVIVVGENESESRKCGKIYFDARARVVRASTLKSWRKKLCVRRKGDKA